MHLNCPECAASVQVDESRLPPNRQTSCPTCGHRFVVPVKGSGGMQLGAAGPADDDAVIELPAPLVTPPPGGQASAKPLVPPPPPEIADLPAPITREAGPITAPPAPMHQDAKSYEDLPAPVIPGQSKGGLLADLPAPITRAGYGGPLDDDLPAPAGPARSTRDEPDLPAPALGHRQQQSTRDAPGIGRTIQGQPPPPLESFPVSSDSGGAGMLDDLPAPKEGRLDLSDFDLSATPAAPGDDGSLPMPKGGIDLPAPAEIVDLLQSAPGRAAPPKPPDLAELPVASAGIELPSGDASYGEVPLTGEGNAVGIALDDLPLTPPGAGASSSARPALDLELPPLGEIELPSSAKAVEKPAAAAGKLDVPMPLDHSDAAGEVELPDGIIDLPRPMMESPVEPEALVQPPAPSIPLAPSAASKGASAQQSAKSTQQSGAPTRRSLPTWLVGVAALGLVAAVAVLGVAMGWFGGNDSAVQSPAPESSEEKLAQGRKLLLQDTPKSYRRAAEAFRAAAKAAVQREQEQQGVVADALMSQALLFPSLRFGPDRKRQSEAEDALRPYGELEAPPKELRVARALLRAVQSKPTAGVEALAKVSQSISDDALPLIYLGFAQLRANKPKRAKASFGRALAAEPKATAALFGQARVAQMLGRPKVARQRLNKLLAANAEHSGAWLLQGQLQLESDQDAAESSLERVLKLASPKRERSTARALLGRIADSRGEADKARAHFKAALELDPKSIAARLGLGRQLLHAGRPKEAMKHFVGAHKAAPADANAALLLAEAQVAVGRPLDARKTVLSLLKQHPRNARAKHAMAELEAAAGANGKAIKLYSQAIELDPERLAPYVGLSRAYLRDGRKSDAFAALKQASSLIQGAEVRNALGELHFELAQLEQARARFEEALEIDATSNRALFNLARTLQAQNQLPDALERYQKLQERDADYPQLAAHIGGIQLEMGAPDQAAKSYERALAVDNPPNTLRLAAGEAFIAAGAFDKALKQADQVLEQVERSTLADALALRAKAHIGLDELGEALVEIKRALDRDRQSRYYVVQARIQERLKRPLDALDSLRRAVELDPGRTDLRLERGRLLVRAGTVRDGLSELEKVLKAEPSNATAHLFKGIAQSDLGDKRAAMAAFQRASALDDKLGEADFRIGPRSTATKCSRRRARHCRPLSYADKTCRSTTMATFCRLRNRLASSALGSVRIL
jgi:predicted Zn finger-like uncharacterized protein